jgi:PAS domain-containing protein
LESSPLAVFAIDAQGAVTYCNPAAEMMTGWMRMELVGHELPFDPNGPMQAKNGRLVECAIWIAPIRATHGPPRGKLIIAAGSNALRDAGLEFTVPGKPRAALRG